MSDNYTTIRGKLERTMRHSYKVTGATLAGERIEAQTIAGDHSEAKQLTERILECEGYSVDWLTARALPGKRLPDDTPRGVDYCNVTRFL